MDPESAERLATRRRERLDDARLYLITDGAPDRRDAGELVAEALEGGVDVVQLREKHADDDAIVALGRRLRALCDEHGALLIVNDRPDLVAACGADGVHLGQDDLSPARARDALGAEALIGLSTHTPEQIDWAREQPVDYIGVGPVHATPTKPGAAAVGTELVRYAAARAARPFFAIGGIDAANVPAVAGAGARRVAVVRAIRDASDPRAAARALRAGVDVEVHAGAGR